MAFVVKNTTSFSLWDLFCPHFCIGCGAIGELLCGCCKKNIKYVKSNPQGPKDLWIMAEREGVLAELISIYKYQSTRAAAGILAELLAEKLPDVKGVTVIPLPTISRHIRQRSFDHTKLLAKKLARFKSWQTEDLLSRVNNTVQVGASAKKRLIQARSAYIVSGVVDKSADYLLLDDVWTTGASMLAAKTVLRSAGATKIRMAVIARSNLE